VVYSSQFIRASFLFHIDGYDESAVTDLSIGLNSVAAPPTSLGTALNNAMQALLTATDDYRANYSRYDGVKLANIATDGSYATEPTIVASTDNCAGANGTIAPQVSVVLSLRSGSTLGKGNYGRMFLPYSGSPNSGPIMNTTQQDLFLTSGQTFIRAVNTAAGAVLTGSKVVIASQARAAQSLGDRVVTQVAVGRVVDTQRRRRKSIPELPDFATI